MAALTWRGGRGELEEPLLAVAGRVLAYGDDAAIASLRRREAAKLVPYGAKTSLAVVGADVDPAEVAAGLARDVALFDQRDAAKLRTISESRESRELLRVASRFQDRRCSQCARGQWRREQTTSHFLEQYRQVDPLEFGTTVLLGQRETQPAEFGELLPELGRIGVWSLTEASRLFHRALLVE